MKALNERNQEGVFTNNEEKFTHLNFQMSYATNSRTIILEGLDMSASWMTLFISITERFLKGKRSV